MKETTEGDRQKINIEPKTLTEEFLESHYNAFISLEKEWTGLGEEAWQEKNFFWPKPKKWELSSYVSIDSKIVGYTIVSEPEKRKGFLHKIVVDRDYQGHGIGSKLFGDMVRKCKNAGIEKIVFKVRTDNESAKALYKKHNVSIKDPIMCPDNIERYQCELSLIKKN